MQMKFLAIGLIVAALAVTARAQSTPVQEPVPAEQPAQGVDQAIEQEVRAVSANLVALFNAAKSEDIANLFLPTGELIDEAGNVYRGPAEIKALLDGYFQTFPGVTADLAIESIRSVGPVVILEGMKTTTKDDATSQVQFISVATKTQQGWRIASMRDFPEESGLTPGENLQVLQWLVGDWVNEGADGRVKINYRWSPDGNFLLGEFQMLENGVVVSTTSQRIAWDPILGKPRSWLFDADGGFSEAVWTSLEDGRWVLRSSAVLPDGTMGSANLTITTTDPSRFKLAGTSRLVGAVLEDDFELIVVKQPPAAGDK